jgi:hypothetical protein
MEGLTTSSPRVMQSLRNGPKKRAQKRFGFVPKPVDKPYHALTPKNTKAWKIWPCVTRYHFLFFAVFASCRPFDSVPSPHFPSRFFNALQKHGWSIQVPFRPPLCHYFAN